MMNIAVLSSISRNAGGVYYVVQYLSKALARCGCVLNIFSPREGCSQEDLPAWDPLKVELYTGFGPLQSSIKLRGLLASSHADLVHVHGIWKDQQWASLRWKKRAGGAVIISPHGMLDPWAVKNSAWKKKLAGRLFANESLQRATCIHALCRSEAESIRAYGLNSPIAVIPNGVELPMIDTSTHISQSLSRKKQLLFLGRIHPKKGLAELLSGWAQARLPGWELLIAGWDDGGHESGLKKLVNELGVGDSVTFIGPVFGEQKELLLRKVDGFILPSFSEGLPMSVLEAWSYRLPVIITDFCNLPEGFNNGAALRIDPNAGSIARGLIQIGSMTDSDLSVMGDNGRSLVERDFTWDKIAQDMKAVYEWCLSGQNAPEHIMF